MYFSAVTITTLGYGDITPLNDMVKTLAAIEAVFGVFLIGTFLFYLAKNQSRGMELQRVQAQKRNLLRSYQFFRQQVIVLFVKGLHNHGYIKENRISARVKLSEKLRNADEYSCYFDSNNEEAMHKLREAVDADYGLVNDLYLEAELFHDQISLAISSIPYANDDSLEWLSGFHRDLARIRRSENIKSEPSNLFLSHLDDIMRNSGSASSMSTVDVFESHVTKL